MPAETNVRELQSGDIEQLLPLLTELGYPVDRETLANRFDAFTAQEEKALVAERGGKIIGLLTLHVTPVLHRAGSVGRITALVVEEACHGQGVGRALLHDAERRLWERECVMIEVTSNKKRTDAHAFYEKLGYEQTSYRFAKTRPER